jgi:hypothetical protein
MEFDHVGIHSQSDLRQVLPGLPGEPLPSSASLDLREATDMLSEKFILLIEALIRSTGPVHADGSPRVVSQSPHVPVTLPPEK